MSVTADTSQVEMTPYVSSASTWSKVHKSRAVLSCALSAIDAYVGASVGVAVVGVSVGVSVGVAVAAVPSARATKTSVTILRDSCGRLGPRDDSPAAADDSPFSSVPPRQTTVPPRHTNRAGHLRDASAAS